MHPKVLRDAKLVEARFRDLLESVPDGIVMVNPDGDIVLCNSQADLLFGYNAGELPGKPIETLLPDASMGRTSAIASTISRSPGRAPWAWDSSCSAYARTAANSRWRSA